MNAAISQKTADYLPILHPVQAEEQRQSCQ
jgi:hypothetical protein